MITRYAGLTETVRETITVVKVKSIVPKQDWAYGRVTVFTATLATGRNV